MKFTYVGREYRVEIERYEVKVSRYRAVAVRDDNKRIEIPGTSGDSFCIVEGLALLALTSIDGEAVRVE